VTPHATPRLLAYAALTAGGMLVAVVLAAPELVAVVVPFAVALVLGLAAPRPREVTASFRTTPPRAVEGDEVEVEVVVRTAVDVARLEVALIVPEGLEPVGPSSVAAAAVAGEPETITFPLRAVRWGVFRPERATVQAGAAAGLVTWKGEFGTRRPLEVHPGTERLRRLLRPARMQPFTGTHVSRARGEGIEFADVRPFVAGDRVRSVNWRATARRGELWINDRHPERNTDVVVFVDTFADVGPPGAGTLDRAVRAAAAVAARHLAAADRVGLVGFGGVVRSVPAGMGVAQLRAIAAALLSSSVVFTWADKSLDILPPRSLPPRALVVALTPLVDPRSVATLADLRARGFDIAILECGVPEAAADPADTTATLARRIWNLERASVRDGFRRSGVPVVTWAEGQPLEAALEEMDRLRRAPRPVGR